MKLLHIPFVLLMSCSALHAEVRTFTSSAGTTLKGELVSVVGDTVTIKKEDGTPLTLKLAAFSRVDQAWLQTQAKAAPAAASAIDPAKATKDSPFVNSLGMKFVPVPGTRVLFCTTMTPRKDYETYEKEAKGKEPPPFDPNNDPRHKDRHLFPAYEPGWNGAKGFCDWLSAKEGRTYRLPTDREWSMAVGIGGQESATATPEELNGKIKGVYAWGSSWPPPDGFGNYSDESFKAFCKKINHPDEPPIIKGYQDGEVATSPLLAYKPNILGLHDMCGNLMQWCDGWYDAGQTQRFLRGAHWASHEKSELVLSVRRPLPSGMTTKKDLGDSFRCVLELPKP